MTTITNSTGVICSICRDPDSNELLVQVSGREHPRLDHLYHEACIRAWVDTGERCCPLCRLNITHVNGVPLPNQAPQEHPLVSAVVANDLVGVQAALTQGGIPPAVFRRVVMTAAIGGYAEVMRMLLANNPFFEETERGETVCLVVRWATTAGHTEVVRLLLANGPISFVMRDAALSEAISGGHVAIARALLANGFSDVIYNEIPNIIALGYLSLREGLQYIAPARLRDNAIGVGAIVVVILALAVLYQSLS